MTKELAKTLTTALVQFIDSERPEGSMCCSNAECKGIEDMFEGDKFDIIEAFIQKKLSRLTEFEKGLINFYNKRNEILPDKDGMYNRHDCEELLHESAKTLLALAKKELLSYADENNPAIEAMADLKKAFECNPDKLPKWLKERIDDIKFKAFIRGCNKGYKDAEKQYNESVAYHFPIMPQRPLCYEPGGTCTNPQMDCVNCPRRTTGGGFNTSSGTSTLKAEG